MFLTTPKRMASLVLCAFLLIPTACAEEKTPEAPPEERAAVQAPVVFVFQDFESEELKNALGGDGGAWDTDPENEPTQTQLEIVEMPGPKDSVFSLKMNYNADCAYPCQNGFWTRLMYFDASEYDHLEFEVKGDPDAGFTDVFKAELKKYKDEKRIEVIKGSADVPVTNEWKTIQIPLNRMTGLFDFSNPEVWKNPGLSRKDLFEFVIVFNSRHVTKKTGTIYIDNLRFVKTGEPGPTPVDSPPRKGEKTPVRLEGMDFAKFLIGRLGGFPKQLVVKKNFPADDREFLLEVARDTWRFFDEIVDQEHGLPLDTIQLGKKEPLEETTWVGDYTNVTNIGVYLMVLVSAADLGFITKAEAVNRIQKTLDTLDKLETHSSGFLYNYYDTTTLERTSYFVSLVDCGWLATGLYVVKNAYPEALKDRVEKMLAQASFSFFYDPVDRQMWHGYYDHLKVYSDYHYGPLYSEPRAISYLAIARGEAPQEHWFLGLVRTFPENYNWQEQAPIHRVDRTTLGFTYPAGHYQWKDLTYVPSWGGSAFESLMPTLVSNEKELAPKGLGLNDFRHALGQYRYATEELGMPVWGMSPSSVPEGGYSEFGAKPFGSKGYKDGVVTPHASALTLEFIPKEAIANLRKLIELYDIYGEYGFYDAVTVKTGLVAYKYLALDQAMILVAINNYLNDGAIRKRFHAEPAMKEAEKILSAEDFELDEEPALNTGEAPASTLPPEQ